MELPWNKFNNILAVIVWPTEVGVFHFKATKPRITLANAWSYKNSDLLFDNLHMHAIKPFAELLHSHVRNLRAPLIIGLKGKQLQENLIACKTKQVSFDTFDFPSAHTHQSGYHYLYPHNDTEHMFYTWQIPHHIIFLYQLATQMHNHVLTSIVPYQSALFIAYTHYKYPAFRSLELARDMARHNHSIEHYFSQESIYRLIRIDSEINPQNYPQLLHATGLVFSLSEMP